MAASGPSEREPIRLSRDQPGKLLPPQSLEAKYESCRASATFPPTHSHASGEASSRSPARLRHRQASMQEMLCFGGSVVRCRLGSDPSPGRNGWTVALVMPCPSRRHYSREAFLSPSRDECAVVFASKYGNANVPSLQKPLPAAAFAVRCDMKPMAIRCTWVIAIAPSSSSIANFHEVLRLRTRHFGVRAAASPIPRCTCLRRPFLGRYI